MRRLTAFLVFLLGIALPSVGQDFNAPGLTFAGAPRFLSGVTSDAKVVEPAAIPALQRRVTLGENEATLGATLDAITEQTGIEFVFSSDVISVDTPVRVEVSGLSLAAALTELLLNARVDVAVVSPTQLALLRRREPQQPGVIVGRVTDASTQQPVVSAQVWVEGSKRSALTDADGRYRLTEVEAGQRKVTASIIGYKRVTHEIEILSGATATVNFALQIAPTPLTEMVVTATGPQRRVELGHVVGRINADSLVKEAPVSSISELLTGRVAGLQVNQSSGIVGGDVQLQVRTPNTLLLGTQPIVIVDGVRYTNKAAFDPGVNSGFGYNAAYGPGTSGGGRVNAARTEVTSPLNDLNVNDIENIEVVKGAAAATLYGTDAANGVIVITTKRGRPGPARWNAYMRMGRSETPTSSTLPSDRYWAWGHKPDGTPFGYTSGGRFTPQSCMLFMVASGACAQDSIVKVPNQLADPDLSIFQSAPQWEYGLNVSGGTQDVRYYIGGALQDETGSLRMPKVFADSIEDARGLTEEQLRPNALRNVNLRSNLTVSLGKQIQLDGNFGFIRRTNRTISNVNYDWIGNGPPADPYGSTLSNRPDEVFSRTSIDLVDRFVIGARAEWRPVSWLRAHASGGLDFSDQTEHSLEPRGQNKTFSGAPRTGEVQRDVTQQRATTATVGLTSTLERGLISSRTSIGAQYDRSLNDVQQAWGTGLVEGGESVALADQRFTDHLYNESVTLGSYVEQTVGFNHRLFLTGALRIDGASNFGQKYQSAVYPKASVSWLASEEPFLPRLPGLDELRLRYAFGVSGRQAYSWMKLPGLTTPIGRVDGTTGVVIKVDALGNEHLRPERSSEHEYGFDLAALNHRVQAGLAWYRRRVKDQILTQTLPAGFGTIYTNLGLTTARGFEANLSAKLVEHRLLSWDVSVLHSSSSTKLEDLGDALPSNSYLGGYVEGYSLGARFQNPVLGFEDVNGDGIISTSEITAGPEKVYTGESSPPRTQTLVSTLGFLDRRIRVSASFNRLAGHVRAPLPHPCQMGCLALLDPATPLEEQGRALAESQTIFGFTPEGQFFVTSPTNVPADETRFAELALAADLPPAILSRLRLRSGTLSVSARNLALWTDYPGDPGSVSVQGIGTGLRPGIPQARAWTFRLDLGF